MAVERSGFQQILTGTSGPLSVTFYDADGDVADPGTVTVTVTRLDGTVLMTAGATVGTGAAARTRALTPAQTAQLDILTCVWSGTVDGSPQTVETTAEVVGDLLYTVSEARAFDGGALSDTDKYLTAWIEDGRWRILDAFRERCGVDFVPRVWRQVLSGAGVCHLFLPDLRIQTVRAIETREMGATTWTAFTAAELADVLVEEHGRITRETLGTFPYGRQNVRVTYEHGHTRPPGEITRAALTVVKNELLKAAFPDRATSQTNETGASYALATAGTKQNPWSAYRYYGLPAVDSVLREFNERVRGVR